MRRRAITMPTVEATIKPIAESVAQPSQSPAFSALADPTREAIVRLLVDRERSVGELAGHLPVSRPAVSKHLRLLQDAGLVRFDSVGTRNVYALVPESLEAMRDALDAMWRQALARFALVANNPSPAKARQPSKLARPAKPRNLR